MSKIYCISRVILHQVQSFPPPPLPPPNKLESYTFIPLWHYRMSYLLFYHIQAFTKFKNRLRLLKNGFLYAGLYCTTVCNGIETCKKNQNESEKLGQSPSLNLLSQFIVASNDPWNELPTKLYPRLHWT